VELLEPRRYDTMKVVISREYGKMQTLGSLVVFDGKEILLKVLTLELPDLGNQKSISCIPEGKYTVHRIYSPKFGNCFHLQDVPGRTAILIHRGNYTKDTRGCILVGMNHIDIDSDGLKDVSDSTTAMTKLLNTITENVFELHVI